MKRLVLVGAAHAHARVLCALLRPPLSGVEVVVFSPELLAPYSGLLDRWKDRIDRRFLQQFRTLGSPQRAAESITLPADAPTVSIGDRP